MLHTIHSSNIFQIRCVLCTFIPPLYCQFQDIYQQQVMPMNASNAVTELQSLYFSLCNDSRLLVRREAATQFPRCLSAFGQDHLPTFYSHLKQFLHDDVGLLSFPCLLYWVGVKRDDSSFNGNKDVLIIA